MTMTCTQMGGCDELRAVQAERDTLRAQLEALQAENERLKAQWAEWSDSLDSVMKQRNALRAQLEAMQRQEPVALEDEMLDTAISWCDSNGINVLGPEELSSLIQSLCITVRDTSPKALEPLRWQPASSPPPENAGEVLVRMTDGRYEIAWPTYWHGSSNAFAQWTFRDPDEDEQPVEWMTIPAHGIGSQQ